MKKFGIVSMVVLISFGIPFAAVAGDFDGSRPLLFSVISVIECTPDGNCREVTADSADLPQFLKIDFEKKRITRAMGGEGKQGTDIERMERVDGKLILQGAEDGVENVRDGLGWTVAISEETGKAILTASGEQVAFVVFGACLPL
jgi:hypothetical protein